MSQPTSVRRNLRKRNRHPAKGTPPSPPPDPAPASMPPPPSPPRPAPAPSSDTATSTSSDHAAVKANAVDGPIADWCAARAELERRYVQELVQWKEAAPHPAAVDNSGDLPSLIQAHERLAVYFETHSSSLPSSTSSSSSNSASSRIAAASCCSAASSAASCSGCGRPSLSSTCYLLMSQPASNRSTRRLRPRIQMPVKMKITPMREPVPNAKPRKLPRKAGWRAPDVEVCQITLKLRFNHCGGPLKHYFDKRMNRWEAFEIVNIGFRAMEAAWKERHPTESATHLVREQGYISEEDEDTEYSGDESDHDKMEWTDCTDEEKEKEEEEEEEEWEDGSSDEECGYSRRCYCGYHDVESETTSSFTSTPTVIAPSSSASACTTLPLTAVATQAAVVASNEAVHADSQPVQRRVSARRSGRGRREENTQP